MYAFGMELPRENGLIRLLDANANRAREGLRVLEDAARFVLDEPSLTAEAKALRHEITALISQLVAQGAVAARDVGSDVGLNDDLASEVERPSLGSVIAAAAHRATEALRALEEYAKIIDGDVGVAFEALRYRAYELDGRLRERIVRHAPSTWRVMVIVSEASCTKPWRDVITASIAGGADAIQLREKNSTKAQLLERTREAIGICRPAGVAVIVNDHIDVAVAAGADGVHVGQEDFPIEAVRRVIGGSMILGGTAHTMAHAERNAAAGCDYCGVGRMFKSRTKPEAPASGVEFLREFTTRWPSWPHLAIGGIDPNVTPEIIDAGGRAVAVCEAVCSAADPSGVVASLRLMLEAEGHRVP